MATPDYLSPIDGSEDDAILQEIAYQEITADAGRQARRCGAIIGAGLGIIVGAEMLPQGTIANVVRCIGAVPLVFGIGAGIECVDAAMLNRKDFARKHEIGSN